jgi:hypothetical protein
MLALEKETEEGEKDGKENSGPKSCWESHFEIKFKPFLNSKKRKSGLSSPYDLPISLRSLCHLDIFSPPPDMGFHRMVDC